MRIETKETSLQPFLPSTTDIIEKANDILTVIIVNNINHRNKGDS